MSWNYFLFWVFSLSFWVLEGEIGAIISFFQLVCKLSPYKKLYETATDFIVRHDLWMNTQVGSHDPDEISTDVDTCYRTIHNLEKIFAEQLAVKDLTSTVSTCSLHPFAAD